MTLRNFSRFAHLPLVLLALVEIAIFVLVPRLLEPDLSWRACIVFALASFVGMFAMGLYSGRQRARTAGVIVRTGLAFVLAMILVMIAGFVAPAFAPFPGQLARIVLAAFAAITLVRMVGSRLIPEDLFKRRVLIYGAGSRAQSVAQLRRRADQRGFLVVGFVPARGEATQVEDDRLIRGGAEDLLELSRQHGVEEIVVAMEDRRREFPVRELLECRLNGIEVTGIATFLERETGRVRLDVVNPSWIIFGEGFRRDPVRQFTKQLFDAAGAIVLLALTWPIMLLAMLAIMIEDGPRAPVLYRQSRVGLDGRLFNVLKFRSMRVDAEKDGQARWATQTDDRITRVGRLIRKIRVDELPQIFNVLGGSMSFVGPRPERPEFVKQLGESIPYYAERHCAKPGITGWAQLCYPYGASEKDALEKLQYDLYYVKNHSLLFDLMILLQTVEVVLLSKGSR